MPITLTIAEPVLRDMISATVRTMKQAEAAATENRTSWPTAEQDLISLEVLYRELVNALMEAKWQESLAAKGGAA
jgi:hypothetical protein